MSNFKDKITKLAAEAKERPYPELDLALEFIARYGGDSLVINTDDYVGISGANMGVRYSGGELMGIKEFYEKEGFTCYFDDDVEDAEELEIVINERK